MERTEDFIYAVILALLGGATVYGAKQIPSRASLGLGADYLPRIVGVLLLVLALCFLVKGIFTKVPVTEKQTQRDPVDYTPILKFILTIVFLATYILLLKKVGFLIMSTLYIIAQSTLMVPKENRNFVRTVILAVGTSMILYLIFSKGLSMLLPPGILKDLL